MECAHGVDSKFRYILVAAKRAHQLENGAKARVHSDSQKAIVIARLEVNAGLVPYIALDGDGAVKVNLA
jgi:DNA-directed RNA polymerase subunit omega